MTKFIYKICSLSEWSSFQKKEKFYGTRKDLLDGYIHFSNKRQINKTLKKHFFKQNKLILLKIDSSKLKKLVWEKSKEGVAFPHLYSYLNLKSVKNTYKIFLTKNGVHSISGF